MDRVLIIRTGAMGDIVLATAVVEAIAKDSPQTAVEFLLKKRFSGILEGQPHISRLWLLDERGEHRGVRGLLLFIQEIQRERFDLVIDLQDNFRSRLISHCLRAENKLRWDKLAWRRRLWAWLGVKPRATRPVFRRYLDTLHPLGLDTEGSRPRLYVAMKNSSGLPPEGFVALAPGAHWPAKRWPREYFVSLAQMILEETGLSIVVVGSAEDRALGAEISKPFPTRMMDLCGRLGLKELREVVARARVLVTNDTGPMHLAEALGVPVLAFFGPTVREFGFAPWRPESRVLEVTLNCRPCSLHGGRVCPRKHFRCLRGITPRQAWDSLREMIDAGK